MCKYLNCDRELLLWHLVADLLDEASTQRACSGRVNNLS